MNESSTSCDKDFCVNPAKQLLLWNEIIQVLFIYLFIGWTLGQLF